MEGAPLSLVLWQVRGQCGSNDDSFPLVCVCGGGGVRIQVNDQIVEVDGVSLVGVSQLFAATVLKNTSGLVK